MIPIILDLYSIDYTRQGSPKPHVQSFIIVVLGLYLMELLIILVENIYAILAKEKNPQQCLVSLLLPPFQNVGYFIFSRYINFAMYLDVIIYLGA